MTIDAHHHFWNPARIPQPWMTDEHERIARTFEPPELEPLLAEAGVAKTVLVQSANHDADTDYMFELAAGLDWVGGVVAWLPLAEPRARDRLDELLERPKLRGVRHLIHNERDPHWILHESVTPGLDLIESAQLVLELPAVYPNHLGDVPELARRHPQLRIMIDHLGKPPLGTSRMAHWRDLLGAAAEFPNVYAKVSGLNTATPSRDWDARDLEPAVRAAVDAFGPGRLACGSDWPVALLNGDYSRVWSETTAAIGRVAGDDAVEILTRTPTALYRLEE
jgi:L-fuconolactonase